MKKLYRILGSVLMCFSVMFSNFTVFAASSTPTVQISSCSNNTSFTTSGTNSSGDPELRYITSQTIFINCSDVSSGTLIIDLSGNSSTYLSYIDSFHWFSEGCRVTYNSTLHRLTVKLDGVQFCSVTGYISSTSVMGNFNLVTSIYSNGLSIVSDSDVSSDLDTIISKFDTLNDYASDIASDINSMYLVLVDMAGDLGDINTAMTSVNNYLSSLDTAVSTLKSLVTTSNAALTSILNTLISVGDDVSSIGDDVSSIDDSVQSIYSQVTDLLTSLNNIDDTLDTISWVNGSISLVGYATEKGGAFSQFSSTVVGTSIYLKYSLSSYNTNVLYKMPVGTRYNNFNDSVDFAEKLHIYSQSGSTWYELDATIYYYWVYRNTPYVIFTFNSIPTGNIILGFEGVSMYFDNSITPQYQYLPSTDIEYWQLLQYFNQYNSNLEIISLLQDLNGFTDGSVDDSAFSSDDSSFDSTFNGYHNTTDSIFDTFEDSVSNLDLTDSAFSISDSVYQGLSFISYNLTRVVTNTSSISVIFYLPLLLGVIMLFLGIRR